MIRWIILALSLFATSATPHAGVVRSPSPVDQPIMRVAAESTVVRSAPVPAPAPAWIDCAAEGRTCRGKDWSEVRYGVGDQWRKITVEGGIRCGNDAFDDPAPNVVKRCQRRTVAAPLMPGDVEPIASNFATTGFLTTNVGVPASGKPDVVGAFRMICTAGQLNYDDPILYPGMRSGSPHLHQWFGNMAGRYDSTYAGLRSAGESTCSNKLNRSAYWLPALMNAAGDVIVPDYISLYYKRRPDGDPECLREAAKGCVGLPTGLRAVSGYDMTRMGEKQPENGTYHYMCNDAGKTNDHRALLADAIADCGGSGQITVAINFGSCWNGALDSADHRSHLTRPSYGSWGYPKCPATHPYSIPGLTQNIAYTIQKSDGEVWFASDRMNGMRMVAGSTFHADYMEAWDPPTRATWERLCIGKLLNCADGGLGDGTMLRRGNLTYKAAVRLATVPAR